MENYRCPARSSGGQQSRISVDLRRFLEANQRRQRSSGWLLVEKEMWARFIHRKITRVKKVKPPFSILTTDHSFLPESWLLLSDDLIIIDIYRYDVFKCQYFRMKSKLHKNTSRFITVYLYGHTSKRRKKLWFIWENEPETLLFTLCRTGSSQLYLYLQCL